MGAELGHGIAVKGRVFDACVAIDLWKARPGLLRLVGRELPVIHLSTLVLSEIHGLSKEEAESYGFVIDDLDILELASCVPSRRISLEDKSCLVLAQKLGLTVVTNEKKLRNECIERGVGVEWGLEILLALSKTGLLSSETAVEVALCVKLGSGGRITEDLLEEFKARLYSSKQISNIWWHKVSPWVVTAHGLGGGRKSGYGQARYSWPGVRSLNAFCPSYRPLAASPVTTPSSRPKNQSPPAL